MRNNVLRFVVVVLVLLTGVSAVSANTMVNEAPSDARQLSSDYVAGYRQLFELNADEIAGLQQVLEPLKDDISDLDNQLQALKLQRERIQQVVGLVQQKLLGLGDLSRRILVQKRLVDLEMKGMKQKFQHISELFFRVKRQFVMEDGDVNLLQLYSSADSPADLLFQDFLLQRVQDQLILQMDQVAQRQESSEFLLSQLQSVEDQLQLYQERLNASQQVINEQEQFRQRLLAQRQQEEDFFQRQLEEALEEQRLISQRIQALASGVTLSAYQGFPVQQMQWPVDPVLGISAYFRDEDYRRRFGMQHDAIDIPTDQLTPVRAPLAGRVLKVRDGGQDGYSYLQLAHRGELSTVYGHVYAFKVAEGDVVKQGEMIALSGGAVGTHGAGRFTTGPHLHFELLKSGKHVDPLDYLPEM